MKPIMAMFVFLFAFFPIQPNSQSVYDNCSAQPTQELRVKCYTSLGNDPTKNFTAKQKSEIEGAVVIVVLFVVGASLFFACRRYPAEALAFVSVAAFVAAATIFESARSAIHEILAAALALIGVVAMGFSCLIHALTDVRSISARLEARTTEKAVPTEQAASAES